MVGSLLIWGSLAGLNSWVLGFNAWPDRDVAAIGRVVMADPPSPSAERLRVSLPAGALPIIAPAELTAAQGGLPGPGGSGADRSASTLQSGDVSAPQGTAPTPAPITTPTTTPTTSPSAAAADSDSDGLPDEWEVSNGLEPEQRRRRCRRHRRRRRPEHARVPAEQQPA